MLKTTLKLDAICAKLSKGLSGLPPQEEPCTGATLPGSNGSPRYAPHQDQEACQPDVTSDLKTLHNGDFAPDCSAQLPMVQATENNGYVVDERPEYNRFVERDGGDDSRCSSPKILSGASKRKSKQRSTRVAAQEADSPSDWDDGSINSFQDCDESLDSGVVGSHQDEPVNGLDQWEEEQEETADHEFTQEHNHDENISMQNIPYTHATNHKANNGNKIGQDDPSSSSSKEAEIAPYKVAGHELRTRNNSKVPIYDESGLSDEDVAAKKASYDPRAIMEYAERSWCNENGTEIEEGLETNGVVCDLEESGRVPGVAQGLDAKPHRRRRGRPSKSEHMKMAEEQDERIPETAGLEEMRDPHPPEQGDVEPEEEEEQVEYMEELEPEDQEEPSQTSASPPSPMSSKMMKDAQMVPATPYDMEGLEAVKEYASDTMKEFLGMYGYMEEGVPAREEDLPIEHIRHILELQRRHAEKKRALAHQRFHQQNQRSDPNAATDRTEPEEEEEEKEEKVRGSDPRSSAFMKLASEAASEPKDPSMLKETDHQLVAPSHAVLQQLAALHQQLRAEESALGGDNNNGSSHHPSDAPHQGLDHHRHHRHHPLGRREDHARQDSPSQQHAGLRERMESLREAAAEGGMSDLCAAPYPGVLAAHLEGKMTNSRMATGKTVKQLIEEQEFMRNLIELGDRPEVKRFSKYDYFIQKLEAGESISKDVPNLRVSKYDSYIRKLKAGQSINKIIGRKVSASQRIRDIISQQIQLKQGGGSGHDGEPGSKEEADAEAIEAAILENEGLAQREFAAAAAAAAASAAAASASEPQLHLDPQRSSNYEYFMSKFNKGESVPRYTLDGVASISSSSSTSAISPPPGMDDSSIDERDRREDYGGMGGREDFAGRDDYGSYEPRDNILKKCLLETGRSDLDSEEGSEKGIKSGTLSTSSSPGLEGSAFNRYIARFGASQDCGRCSYQFKEHYHCLDKDCKFARFTRKEDVIRHYNWHKRRDNSLQHGFMRFSPSDDCRPYYPGCTLNMKNTHYHCMQNGCHKVYTSTSDVLTHENFHKKNFTLLSDGFQRFRATEDCGTPLCSFYGQKTTHFHCRRPGCDFVFKNKCDIEKHKTFHMKDDIYRKDGFRKFSKHETCKFDGCRYSNTLNHFHCIRNGCNFTFTAANQMHSHKRKHERRHRMMEYETGRHFMRSIRPKMKLPLPRVNPTYRSLHSNNTQIGMGEKPLIMPPCPAIIFKSDPGAASIAERAALAGQSAALGASQTSPLAGQMMALPSHSASRPDVQAIQPSVITSAPSSSGSTGSLESMSNHGAYDPARSYPQDTRGAMPDAVSATSVITNTSAVATAVEGHHSSDESGDERPMDLQMYDKYRRQQMMELDSNDEDRPTDLSMHDKSQTDRMEEDEEEEEDLPSGFAKIAEMENNKSMEGEDLNDSLNLPIASFISPPDQMVEGVEGSERGGERGSERVETEGGEPRCSPITIKKEPRDPRDGEMRQDTEAWQKYFRRYTANDHCHSTCELLYKGHYHCVVEGCGEYFRSKEGVNKHTRYHLMSDEASELDFHYYQHGQTCENTFKGCPFSPLAHYHCMWSLKPGSYCGEVVHTGSSLMKPHYEKHHQNPELEAIRHSDAEKPGFVGTPIEQPPPKVVLKDQTMKWFTTPPPAPANDKGYAKMDPGKCSKPECPLIGQKHYHCTRTECNFATESPDMLHDHKSNEKLIFDSFRQFSRKLDCRRPGCKYNLLHKHYHCMHQGCQFSFLQIQQMESHGRKHMRRIYGKFFNRPNNNSPTGPQQLVLPILPLNSGSPPGILASPPGSLSSPPGPFHMHPTMVSLASSSPLHQLVTSSSPVAMMSHAMPINSAGSLQSMFLSPPPSSLQSVLTIPQPPLSTHNGLIMGGPSPKTPTHQFLVPIAPLDAEDPTPSTSNPMSSPISGLQMLPNFQLGRWKFRQSSVISPPRISPPNPHKRPLTLVEEDPGAPSGYKRYKRGPLDSSMQERFERFERNVHCGESNCQFAMNTTHYHCRHTGCNYKFAGKTMMYKHAQHHDRVDSIIQDDFQRFKASVSCDRSDCEYTAKNTHFHCLRCPFICTDSGKVPIHRKQHAKTEAVSAAGFKQFTSSEKCISEDCKYSQKYSHFHCLRQGCMQAVIGMTQMDSHSRKHHL